LDNKYHGSFEVLETTEPVVHLLELSPILEVYHVVLNFLLLKKYVRYLDHILDYTTTYMEPTMQYHNITLEIMDIKWKKSIEPNCRTDKNLMETSYIVKDNTWELSFETKKKYTHMLFDILAWEIFPSWGVGEM